MSPVQPFKGPEGLPRRLMRVFNDVKQCMLHFLDLQHRQTTSGRSFQANPFQGTSSMERATLRSRGVAHTDTRGVCG